MMTVAERNYRNRVEAFNQASGSSYLVAVHFLRIRKTSRGIKIGFSLGKPEEINCLRSNVAKAGAPYYCNF